MEAAELDAPRGAELVPDQQQAGQGDALRARIELIDAAAKAHVDGQRPRNTLRSYAGDWKAWTEFCAAAEVPVWTLSTGLLVGFVEWLDQRGAAVATIDRRLTGVVVGLRERDVVVPADGAALAREALKRVEQRLAEDGEHRGRGQAPALTVEHLRTMSTELPDTLIGTRDRAVLLMGFAIGARRSALAQLHVADIELERRGLLVHRRWGKTGADPEPVPIPYGVNRITCPVRAWLAWQEAAGLTDGKAFRRIDRHGNIGPSISAQAIGTIVTEAGERAGLTIRFTGQSARAGLATEARRAGHSDVEIADQGGWVRGSKALLGYLRDHDRWERNALNDIGL
jgi:integrase